MTLEDPKGLNLKKLGFFWKFLFLGKNKKSLPPPLHPLTPPPTPSPKKEKSYLFRICHNLIHWCVLLGLKIMHKSVLYDSTKTTYLKKNLVLQLWFKLLQTNQIWLFIDHKYLWKGSINNLNLLHEDNLKGKVESGTTTFGCVRPSTCLVKSSYKILWSSILLEGMNW